MGNRTPTAVRGIEQSSELTVKSSWIDGYAHISIQPPQGTGSRVPCDICCVVDTSGSMGS